MPNRLSMRLPRSYDTRTGHAQAQNPLLRATGKGRKTSIFSKSIRASASFKSSVCIYRHKRGRNSKTSRIACARPPATRPPATNARFLPAQSEKTTQNMFTNGISTAFIPFPSLQGSSLPQTSYFIRILLYLSRFFSTMPVPRTTARNGSSATWTSRPVRWEMRLSSPRSIEPPPAI